MAGEGAGVREVLLKGWSYASQAFAQGAVRNGAMNLAFEREALALESDTVDRATEFETIPLKDWAVLPDCPTVPNGLELLSRSVSSSTSSPPKPTAADLSLGDQSWRLDILRLCLPRHVAASSSSHPSHLSGRFKVIASIIDCLEVEATIFEPKEGLDVTAGTKTSEQGHRQRRLPPDVMEYLGSVDGVGEGDKGRSAQRKRAAAKNKADDDEFGKVARWLLLTTTGDVPCPSPSVRLAVAQLWMWVASIVGPSRSGGWSKSRVGELRRVWIEAHKRSSESNGAGRDCDVKVRPTSAKILRPSSREASSRPVSAGGGRDQARSRELNEGGDAVLQGGRGHMKLDKLLTTGGVEIVGVGKALTASRSVLSYKKEFDREKMALKIEATTKDVAELESALAARKSEVALLANAKQTKAELKKALLAEKIAANEAREALEEQQRLTLITQIFEKELEQMRSEMKQIATAKQETEERVARSLKAKIEADERESVVRREGEALKRLLDDQQRIALEQARANEEEKEALRKALEDEAAAKRTAAENADVAARAIVELKERLAAVDTELERKAHIEEEVRLEMMSQMKAHFEKRAKDETEEIMGELEREVEIRQIQSNLDELATRRKEVEMMISLTISETERLKEHA